MLNLSFNKSFICMIRPNSQPTEIKEFRSLIFEKLPAVPCQFLFFEFVIHVAANPMPRPQGGKLFDSGPFIILLFRIRYFSEGILLRDGCVFTNKRGYCCSLLYGSGVNLGKSAALVLRIIFFSRLEIPPLRRFEGVVLHLKHSHAFTLFH